MKRTYFFIFILLLSGTIFADSQKLLEIIKPKHNSLYGESYASIVIKVNDARIDKLVITTDAYEPLLIDVNVSKKEFYCKCKSCHDGKIDRRNKKFESKSKYLTVGTVSKTCLSCHKGENAPKWFDKKYQHDPAEGGSCNKCHNPHSSENRFFIRKVPYKLCGNCHKK